MNFYIKWIYHINYSKRLTFLLKTTSYYKLILIRTNRVLPAIGLPKRCGSRTFVCKPFCFTDPNSMYQFYAQPMLEDKKTKRNGTEPRFIAQH